MNKKLIALLESLTEEQQAFVFYFVKAFFRL